MQIHTECFLIPIFRRNRDNTNIEENNLQFYGPASNCGELGKLGYTLNGYYLVKNSDLHAPSSIKAIVDVVYCQFQQVRQESSKKGKYWIVCASL